MLKRFAIAALIALNLALVAGLVYISGRMLAGKPLLDAGALTFLSTGTAQSDVSQGASSVAPGSADAGSGAQSASQAGEVFAPAGEPVRVWNTIEASAPTLSQEMFAADARMLALPSNGVVSTEYFRTALFIGDSITQGIALYPGTGKTLAGISAVAAFKGTGPKQIVENGVAALPDGTKVAMWDFIAQQTPMNIYVMIGTNAMVSSTDEAIIKYYGDLLDALRTQFPNIPIYVQSITPVTEETAAARPNLSNDRIRLLNNAIAQITVQRGMYYVNLHEVLENENGALKEEYAYSDGMHFKPDGYAVWIDYLSKHTAYNPYNEQFLLEPYHS